MVGHGVQRHVDLEQTQLTSRHRSHKPSVIRTILSVNLIECYKSRLRACVGTHNGRRQCVCGRHNSYCNAAQRNNHPLCFILSISPLYKLPFKTDPRATERATWWLLLYTHRGLLVSSRGHNTLRNSSITLCYVAFTCKVNGNIF